MRRNSGPAPPASPFAAEDPPGYFPRILGHEAYGVVESVGKNVADLTEGDTVIPIFLPDCGECMDCRSKKSNLCTKLPFKVSPWAHRHETSRFTDLNGDTVYHFLYVSSFSEYTVVDIAHLTKVDSAIPPNRACLLSCGVSTGVGAAWRTAKVEAGSSVAIFGLGAIGLAVAEGARLCGATRIIGVDVNPDKFEIGKKFGVTDFVNSIECGNRSVSQGWGKTVVLGVDKPGSQLNFSSSEVLLHGKTLSGSLFGGLKPKSDVPILLKRYMDKELRLDEFVTHEVSFEDINKAFDLLLGGKGLRCVIRMDNCLKESFVFFGKELVVAMAEEEKRPSGTAGKTIRCRAAVARKAGEPLVMEEVVVAPPSSHEVRIKILCTSLCYSDITFWKMEDPPGYFPRILGHEAYGVVESVGENVADFTEGDTVIPIFLPDCGECTDCRSKKSNLCTKLPFKVSPWMHRDETSRFTDLNGDTVYHFLYVSSFSEYTVVDIAHLTKVDPALPPNRACLLSCGVSTGIGAAWRTAKVEAGSSVAIFGLGAIGLAVAEGARLCGATRIIGVDVNPDKFEIGKKFGVTDFVNSRECGNKTVSQVIIEMTDGGADYCFECVGLSSIVREAYDSCRKGWGKTVVLGVDKPGSQLNFSSFEVLHHGKTLCGSLFGGLKPKSDVPILLKRYMDKELRLDEFVTHEVSFEDINKAFDLLLGGKSLRCVIWMDN
ncbi:hypothetical protein RJ639_028592 [Escallonia herrerae]|uniref:Alcohol dehydrogenase n=1 Tax=Escallonia herrerae TaxID=1293975 RepID=A0AA88XHG4_9ASTE|nr:hypothetical protein RJ639_028592 [Escallonia herrerae]